VRRLITRIGVTLSAVNAIMYTIMLLSFYMRARKHEAGSAEHKMFMKQQAAAMPTVKLMSVLYFLFNVVSQIIMNICSRLDRTNSVVVVMMGIGNVMKACSF
jgi:hypothetical protein